MPQWRREACPATVRIKAWGVPRGGIHGHGKRESDARHYDNPFK